MVSPSSEPSKGGQPQQDEVSFAPGAVIDPTKNVLDLVKAESKYQDGMRDALERLVNAKAEGEAKLQSATISAESRRLDQLASLRLGYETRIAEMLSKSVESTSTLVSDQLLQIQATFNERVTKLEQFRYESSGKTSVSDPALASALASLANGQMAMQTVMTEALGKMNGNINGLKSTDDMSAGKSSGRAQFLGIIFGTAGFVAAVFSIAWALLRAGGAA